jgi:MFS family permease
VTAEPTYRTLLADRRVSTALAAVNIGRLASGLVPFGMIATFTSDHQLGWAGAAFAAFLIGSAVVGPLKGALIDKFGARRLLLPMAVSFAAVTAGAAVTARQQDAALYPVALILTAAAATLGPPNSAVLRTVWTEIARSEAENTRLHSLDSVIEEATFVVAPLLTSAIWVAVGAQWAVIVGGLSALAGTLWFSRILLTIGADQVVHGSKAADSSANQGRKERRISGVLLSRNGIAIVAPMVALGVVMGALSVGYPAWTLRHSHVQLAGVLMALDSVGGIAAGLIYGRLPDRTMQPWHRYFATVLILVAGAALVAVSTNLPTVMLASLIVGASLTPMYIIAFVLVGASFPNDRRTIVNSSITSAYNLGSGCAAVAVGAALGRWQLGPTLLVVGLVALALGTGALLGRRPAEVAQDTATAPAVETQSS